jgi:hypothetical protein
VDYTKPSSCCVLALLVAACGGRAHEHTDDAATAGGRAIVTAGAGEPGSGGAGRAAAAGTSGSATGAAGEGHGGAAGHGLGSGGAGEHGGADAAVVDASSAGAPGGDAAAGVGGSRAEANNDCLDGITDFAAAGPFAFEQRRVESVQMWIPDVPAGCRVPIVHFANGTAGVCATYKGALEHLASHGFLTTCYESPATGAGTQCVTAIETALAEYPDLADLKVGSGGHGTGGGAALLCVAHAQAQWGDALQIVGHGSEPDVAGLAGGWMDVYARIASPIFIFNGSEDFLVSENATRPHFDALAPGLEAYWYEGVGAPHVPVPVAWMKDSMVAWFRWQLLDDGAACEYVKAMPGSDDWDEQEVRNATDC